ncbi:HDOD domain-containing protein [Reinekea marinisedimentorum]|uniref:HD-like signal output (HDOD) protein n=1 Tax=Reinekea marinisedimentorum TaxID=230495 RepID=A0A4V2UJJ0_9GAMM|nr:HDOD domain-containing protein [Reinekea marinisedimentorum]TCS40328.1 HD-like signal output (HDOD) protein [Reinekea marinisedimentorum]
MNELSAAASKAANSISSRIRKGEVVVPLLPEVARKVLEVANDADSDASQLAKIIQSDQSMAAHILRIANSPAYTPAGNITSLQQAISRLGMQAMVEVAIAASVNANMFHAPGYEQHIQSILEGSLLTGLWAKEVARVSRRNVEAAFLCGLLHNIGRPMVLQWLSEMNTGLSEQEILSVESALLLEANYAVVEKWGLPEIVLRGVCEYSGPLEDVPEAGLLVRAGQLFASWMLAERDKKLEDNTEHGGVLALLTLYSAEIEKLKEKVDDVVQSREAMRV